MCPASLGLGPTGDTMEDFWRMVWEKDVSLIVMLTGIIERGRVGQNSNVT